MKLKEFLDKLYNDTIFESVINSKPVQSGTLDKGILDDIKSKLSLCDELKNVTEFDIIDLPFLNDDRNEVIESQTLTLTDNMEFSGRCYIHSIHRNVNWSDRKLYDPVKNGASITPILFNSELFTPYRRICVEFSPTGSGSLEDKKNELIQTFKDVLENPSDYLYEPDVTYTIRGIFERVSVGDRVYARDFGQLNFDYDNQTHFPAFYVNGGPVDGSEEIPEVSMSIEKVFIPIEYKDAFIKWKGERKLLGKVDIDQFINENNIKI